jgi:hypothetical protein
MRQPEMGDRSNVSRGASAFRSWSSCAISVSNASRTCARTLSHPIPVAGFSRVSALYALDICTVAV